MDPNLTSLEVIGMAIRSEEDAARFYNHIARMIGNETVKAKYLSLAKEEAAHRKLLVENYQKISGADEMPPKIPGNPETAEGGAIPFEIENSLEELLKLAIERENDARDFYRKAANSAIDITGRSMLEYLSNVEQDHAAMLEKELQTYLADKAAYTGESEPGLVHLGP